MFNWIGRVAKVRKKNNKQSHRLLYVIALFVVAAALCIAVSYATVPMRKASGEHFDALLVLGAPATIEGKPSDAQESRVVEAVKEYQRGRAQHVVLSGGAAANQFVEAHVMAGTAELLGVPASVIVEEGRSLDTYQNLQNSQKILDAHGWRHVEIISSAEHLHRAAILLGHTHLNWQTHAAPPVRPSVVRKVAAVSQEAVAVTLLRCFGMRTRPMIHATAKMLRYFGYTLLWIRFEVVHILTGRPSVPFRPLIR